MTSETVDGRYAQILFTTASKTEKISIIHNDLTNLNNYFEKIKNLRNFIADKTFDKVQQKEVLDTISANLDQLTLNFIGLLKRNNARK